MVESDVKKAIKKLITARGGFWSDITGGPYSKPGDPDIVVCYREKYIGLEGKYFNGRPSQAQKDRKMQIEAAGGRFLFPTSTVSVEKLLDEIDRELDSQG